MWNYLVPLCSKSPLLKEQTLFFFSSSWKRLFTYKSSSYFSSLFFPPFLLPERGAAGTVLLIQVLISKYHFVEIKTLCRNLLVSADLWSSTTQGLSEASSWGELFRSTFFGSPWSLKMLLHNSFNWCKPELINSYSCPGMGWRRGQISLSV